MDGIPRSTCYLATPSPVRRLLNAVVLTVCLLLLVRAYFLEPFHVPTGSMAPTLLGHHRSGVCPRCAFVVAVGRTPADRDGTGGDGFYARASCPNCGFGELNLGKAPETKGNHVLVNKSLYGLRRPRRWEVVVFRLFGMTFIKRLIGLGGEEIELVDGDIYVDGKLARKTFDEFLGMRILMFDNDFAPETDGWKERWEFQPENRVPFSPRQPLLVDGRSTPQLLTYRNYSLDERKCLPIVNEYAYNGGNQEPGHTVHDFMAEALVEVAEGKGTVGFALADGGAEVEVALGVGEPREVAIAGYGMDWGSIKNLPRMQLVAGKRYHIEVALVDRRLTVRVDGRDVFAPVDLPEARERDPVVRPLRFRAKGVLVRLDHVRLYRDIHYTQVGKNAVHGRSVRLGIDQTFVLGDNSPNSEDSRFWPNQGAVPLENLVGRAFLVHLASRTAIWQAWGRQWQCQLPDWERVRWLR